MGRVAGNPDEGFFRELEELEERVRNLEHRNPDRFTVSGPRTDLSSGYGPRISIGIQIDGTGFVVERWTAAGVRTVATFS